MPNSVIVATAELISRSYAFTTGAAAAIAELPHTALPIPSRTAIRLRTPSQRPARTAKPHAVAHRHDDEHSGLGSDPRDRMEVEAQSEQRDPDAEDVLDREPAARHGMVARRAEVGDGEPDQHRERNLEADRERVRERQVRDRRTR